MNRQQHWEETLEDLLSSKAFVELSKDEQRWVLNYLSREEYESMRQVETNIKTAKASNALEPRAESWTRIAAAQQRQPRLFSWKISAMAACVSWLVVGSAAYYLGTIRSNQADGLITKPISVTKIDTVYVATAPDTVFVQRVIYREKPRKSVAQEVRQPMLRDNNPSGVSMKEKEDLNSLLVSGEDE